MARGMLEGSANRCDAGRRIASRECPSAAHHLACDALALQHLETGGRTLKIWIDADATPREVKEIVFRAAKRLGIDTVLVANRPLTPPAGNAFITSVRVSGGADVADAHIVAESRAGDLVVTQDIPLAALLVPNGITVLDPRGDEHTTESIGERLSMRDFMEQARGAGMITGGPAPFDARAKQAFAGALDRALTRLVRAG